MDTSRKESPRPVEAKLGLWDAVSIIVGIIIGVGIFRLPGSVFNTVPDLWWGLGVWLLGGLFALVGAFCFAELATAYPRSGGEYVYLTRAFGPLAGYLFAWAQLTIIRPGSIGAVAYLFAEQADKLMGWQGQGTIVLACLAVLLLTWINVLGVTLGSLTQNILTLGKLLGLVALVTVGLAFGDTANLTENSRPAGGWWFAGVMTLVLWAYSGWHEAAYVVAEVKDRQRTLPRSLLIGTAVVTLVYLLVNAAYLYGLGFAGIRAHGTAFADELVGLAFPGYGSTAMAILIIVSALGALNGMIFTTARIYAEFGVDHRLFAPLSHWSRRWGTPVRALIVQGAITFLLMLSVWWVGGNADTFDSMLYFTAAAFWFFFLLTGIAFFVLRQRNPLTVRPFRVPLYPVLPIVFCCGCAFMTVGVIIDVPRLSFYSLSLLVVGLPFYFWPQKPRRREAPRELEPVG